MINKNTKNIYQINIKNNNDRVIIPEHPAKKKRKKKKQPQLKQKKKINAKEHNESANWKKGLSITLSSSLVEDAKHNESVAWSVFKKPVREN